MIYRGRAPYSTGALGTAIANKDFRFFLPKTLAAGGRITRVKVHIENTH